jgi:hypothetical protein
MDGFGVQIMDPAGMGKQTTFLSSRPATVRKMGWAARLRQRS